MEESLDVVVSTLLMCGFDFQISDDGNLVVRESSNFSKILKYPISDIDVYYHNERFFGRDSKKINIDGKAYSIVLYNDITKYLVCILNSRKDSLTSLPNRSEIELFIDRAMDNAAVYVLVMVDIDNFKQVNDTYGHDIGDEVLTEFGKILNEFVTGENFVGRYGGEEFQMFFKTNDIQAVENILNQIRNKIKNSKYADKLNFSAGMAIYDGTISVRDVMKQADKAMYHVKNNGKNANALYNETMEAKTKRK